AISPGAARDRVALYLLLTMAPFAVVAPVLGPLLDKYRGGRRLMVIGAAGGRAVVCLFMASHLNGLLLFPLAFTVLVCSKAHMVTKSALVPATVGSEGELVEANSRLAVLAVLGGIAAAIPGIAILKIPFLGAPWLMRVAAVVFVAAVVAGLRLVRPAESRSTAGIAEERAELHAATIRLSVTAMAVLRACVGFLAFLAAFALRGTDSSPLWYGAILAASTAGSFLGATAAPRLRRAVAEEKILGASLALVFVAGLLAAWIGGRPGLTVLATALGIAAGTGKLAFDSIVQRDAPDAVWGRTFARFETRFQLVWVLAAAIPVVIHIPSVVGMLVIAGACAAGFVGYVGGLSAAHKVSSTRSDSGG
ncbi:MAG: hypothetical protein M3159_03490, partial [Actinomycetota bacterium]|nr:hypothetical protein [Actinomycetota bacterium]